MGHSCQGPPQQSDRQAYHGFELKVAPPSQVTRLLLAWHQGDEAALNELLPLVYGELRRLARSYVARERPGRTLQPTALINEVYLRLVDIRQVQWQNRAQFIALCARLMRRILVDAARSRGASKRGSGALTIPFDERLAPQDGRAEEVIALDEALSRLAETHPRRSQVVELRVFGGLTVEESAEALHVSVETIMRDWRFAKAWLARALNGDRSARG
jgi:RNA polymerase sigma-70 factor (ECF subfamily)